MKRLTSDVSADEVGKAFSNEVRRKASRPVALVSDSVPASSTVGMEADRQGCRDLLINQLPDEAVVAVAQGAGRIGSSRTVSLHGICQLIPCALLPAATPDLITLHDQINEVSSTVPDAEEGTVADPAIVSIS
jgi:hypothetical protein